MSKRNGAITSSKGQLKISNFFSKSNSSANKITEHHVPNVKSEDICVNQVKPMNHIYNQSSISVIKKNEFDSDVICITPPTSSCKRKVSECSPDVIPTTPVQNKTPIVHSKKRTKLSSKFNNSPKNANQRLSFSNNLKQNGRGYDGIATNTKHSPEKVLQPKMNDNGTTCSSIKKSSQISSIKSPRKTLVNENTENIFQDWEFDELLCDDFHIESNVPNVNTLQLSGYQRCTIVNIWEEDGKHGKFIQVRLATSEENAVCHLRGLWRNLNLKVGDIVSIQACGNSADGWFVDNKSGFIVHHADLLVTGTAVVGSLFCKRKGILSDRFRGIDSNSSIMVIGSLVHELLQKVLKEKIFTSKEMEKAVNTILKLPSTISMLYACGLSSSDARKEMWNFIPHLNNFVAKYICGVNKNLDKENWQGTICDIEDIEENIWSPQLGIKGKVDVTVRVKPQKSNDNLKVMPLELKTGRSTFSAEHRGQVILYSMMMAELGEKVDSGLLLYLRDGSMREIKVGHPERRDLIMLRNELAYYVKTKQASSESKNLHSPLLPEPIHHHSACQKCPYLTICSVYLNRDENVELSSDHPLKLLIPNATSHLTDKHVDYLLHWGQLLHLEDEECQKKSYLEELWIQSPAVREQKRRCISNLIIRNLVEAIHDRYLHIFESNSKDLQEFEIGVGDYVLVSTDTRLALASGTITSVSNNSLSLLLDRDVTKRNLDSKFHVDLYESQSMMSYNFTNLGYLMENTPTASKLRLLIIDKKSPRFSNNLPLTETEKFVILKHLNPSQINAIKKAVNAEDYLLIKGFPGTGKTATIVALIELLVTRGQSVLITSNTHSAVDNVLLRLQSAGMSLLRLGPTHRIHPLLRCSGEAQMTLGCSTPEELESFYASQLIVGTTCLGASHPLLQKQTFDFCIVDESTQVLQPTVLRSLFSARKFILIGDPDQLPPIARSRKARDFGICESLFVRLDSEVATACLDIQYRMNNAIMQLANCLTYKNQMKCANDSTANAIFKSYSIEKLQQNLNNQYWLNEVLSTEIEKSVIFLNTGNIYQNEKKLKEELISFTGEKLLCTNLHEAALVITLLKILKMADTPSDSIGIISPYRSQVSLLKSLTSSVIKCPDIEVNTVDQYQGRDKEIIIFSCTKSCNMELYDSDAGNKSSQESEILNDNRRLTVAITRAKHKIIIIGDRLSLERYNPFKELIKNLDDQQILNVNTGTDGFEWSSLLENILPELPAKSGF